MDAAGQWANSASDGAAQPAGQPAQQTAPATQPAAPAAGPAQQALTAAQHPDRSALQPTTTQTPGSAASVSPAPATQNAPLVLTPVRSGLSGIVQKIADVLGGKTTPDLYQDADGNKYTYNRQMSPGEQWRRIGGEALAGAAAGLAAGKGAGNAARAPLAGFQAGEQLNQQRDQQAQQMTAEARQAMLDKANAQMLRMNLAERSWQLGQHQLTADRENADFYQKQIDGLVKQGGQVLGTAAHEWDLAGILKVNPDLMKDLVQRGVIEIRPHVNADGVHDGVVAIKMPDDGRHTMLPAGTPFYTLDPVSGKPVEHRSADPMTQFDKNNYDTAFAVAQSKWIADKQKLQASDDKHNLTQAQTREANARSVEAGAQANRANAEAKKATAVKGLQPGESQDAVVDQIGRGQMPVGRMAYLLSRNQGLADAVAQRYPGFDGSKVDAYEAAYKKFTSGKEAEQLNAVGAVLPHLMELKQMNTVASHIPGTPDYNAYRTQAERVATELARFYGNETIPGIKANKDALVATLPGNRQAAIDTSVRALSDKLNSFEQQWRNAAPSAAYEAEMPQIPKAAKAARAALDPEYAKRYNAEMVTVQAPGAPPGQIPRSNVAQFKKQYPQGTVSE